MSNAAFCIIACRALDLPLPERHRWSNLLVPVLIDLNDPAMLYGHIKSDERLRNAVYLFGGKLIYKALSIRLGLPYYDMALFMSMF